MTRADTSEQVARDFLAVAPRPKLRKVSDPKPGAQVEPPARLTVYEDAARGLALIRGKRVGWVLDVAAVAQAARWSPSAKGFVVAVTVLPDVCAAADSQSVPYRVKRVQTGVRSHEVASLRR